MLTLSSTSRARLEAASARASKLVADRFGPEVRLSATIREDAVISTPEGPGHLVTYTICADKPVGWTLQNQIEELIDRAHDYVSEHLPLARETA